MARSFTGTPDKIAMGAAAATADMTTGTVAAWVNPTSLIDNMAIVSNSGGAAQGFVFRLNSDGTLSFVTPGLDERIGTATTAVTTGTWWYVACAKSGSQTRFVRVSTLGVLAGENFAFLDTAGNGTAARIGCYNSGTDGDFFNGSIAQVGVWIPEQLSDADLLTMAFACLPSAITTADDGFWQLSPTSPGDSPEPDLSGNGYNGTVTGTTWTTHPINCGGAAVDTTTRRYQIRRSRMTSW